MPHVNKRQQLTFLEWLQEFRSPGKKFYLAVGGGDWCPVGENHFQREVRQDRNSVYFILCPLHNCRIVISKKKE